MRGTIAAAVLSALALTTLPAVAHAAPGPTVAWANSVSEDLGTLQVGANAEAGIASLRAYIVSYSTGQDVAVVDDLTLHSGTAKDGVWRTPGPLRLPELRSYRVDVEATDMAGAHAPRRQVGSLAYLVATQMTFTADTTTVTYNRRTIDVSGVLTGTWPGTREVKPVVGGEIWLDTVWGSWSAEVTTAADGSFAATATVDRDAFYEGEARVTASSAAGSPYLTSSAQLTVTADPEPSRITAQISEQQVDKGASVVLSGQLTWQSPEQGWQPIPNAVVAVVFCSDEDRCPNSFGATTDANGRYELTVTPWETGFYRVGHGSSDVFIADARTKADIVVYQPAQFSGFTAALDDTGAVTASGRMKFDFSTPGTIPVQIQFRASGGEEWTTVATVPHAQWDGTGHFFSAKVTDRAAGEWRAFYAGVSNQFRPTHSNTVVLP